MLMLLMTMFMLLFYTIIDMAEVVINIDILNYFFINFELNICPMNSIFCLLIIYISLKIMFYVNIYFKFSIMKSFKINMMIFVMSMLLLVMSNSFIIIFIAWDGLGISSFFLIMFYLNKDSSISSLITFFFNRMGDFFMLMVFSLLMNLTNNIQTMNLSISLCILFFICLITKSSQIPFGVWLPMAMSAPTPISSLVHSSTLVTAGLFLMMKINLFFKFKEMQLIIFIFSLTTFLMGGIFSCMIMDFKKAIAFSTLSQLGFILTSMVLGNYVISFIHLLFHAFFKSSLFMNLGLFMMNNFSTQDLRIIKFNYLNKFNNMTMMISCMNLMGLVATSGFISKDLILMNNFIFIDKYLVLSLFYFGCIMTGSYSIKFILIMNMFKIKLYPQNNKIYFNKMMSGILISSVMLIIIPILMMDLLIYDMNMFVSTNNKLMFLMIIMFSLFIFKLLMSISLKMMFFSSMVMIMELLNKTMSKIFLVKNLVYYLMMINEMSQLFILSFILEKNLVKLNYLINYKLVLINIVIMVIIMKNLKITN